MPLEKINSISFTDACISWETKLELLQKINGTLEQIL